MPGQITTSVPGTLALAAQLGLAIVFFFSAMPKLRNPLAFARNVATYEILPATAVRTFALLVILAEVFLVIALLAGFAGEVALPLAAALLVSFLIGGGINLRRGRKVPCGCFGSTSEQVSPRTLARLLLLLTAVLFLGVFRLSVSEASHGLGATMFSGASVSDVMQTIFLAAFLILVGAWGLSLPELILLVRHWRQRAPSPGSAARTGEKETQRA